MDEIDAYRAEHSLVQRHRFLNNENVTHEEMLAVEAVQSNCYPRRQDSQKLPCRHPFVCPPLSHRLERSEFSLNLAVARTIVHVRSHSRIDTREQIGVLWMKSVDPLRPLAFHGGSRADAGHDLILMNIQTGAMQMQNFHCPSLIAAGLESPSRKSSKRAQGPGPAPGTFSGAQGFRVRLRYGLVRTNKTSTSVPATTAACAKVPTRFVSCGSGTSAVG
jgi:hypothetical protein